MDICGDQLVKVSRYTISVTTLRKQKYNSEDLCTSRQGEERLVTAALLRLEPDIAIKTW